MPRRPSGKPWRHEASGYWCATLGGKRTYLDKDYKAACRKLRERLAETRRAEQGGSREWLDASFVALADEFLDDVQARKKPTTHEGYRYQLLRALKIIGPQTRVGDIGKIHLAKIEQRMNSRYSPTTINNTIAVVQSVYAWAVRHDLLLENPLVGYKKPAGRKRNRTVTDAEFLALCEASDPAFKRVLVAMRHTGCRPGEIRSLIWEWVDLERGLWVFPDHKTITQQREPRPRYVPLSEEMVALCRRLTEAEPSSSDHVFLNAHGAPYTKDALCRKMARVRKRAGIEKKSGEQLVLYSNRHTFGTNAAGQVSDIELAGLLGHTDVRTTQRYVHLNPDRLKAIRHRLDGQAPGSA